MDELQTDIVREHLKKYGLVTKTPKSFNEDAALGFKLTTKKYFFVKKWNKITEEIKWQEESYFLYVDH